MTIPTPRARRRKRFVPITWCGGRGRPVEDRGWDSELNFGEIRFLDADGKPLAHDKMAAVKGR